MNKKSIVFIIAAICILFFIYAPFEIYASNIDDIDYDIYDMLHVLPFWALAAFIVCSAACLLLFRFAGRKLKKALSAAALWLFVSFAVQGTFFASGIPVMTGDEIDWSGFGSQRAGSAFLFIGIAVIVLVAAVLLDDRKFSAVCSAVGSAASFMMILSIVLMCFTVNHLTDRKNIAVTGEYMLDMSSDENFVILVLDGMDGGRFEEITPEHPEYSDILTDFTFFRNTLGSYPLTGRSIPFIVCGDWYECQTTPQEYAIHAFSESPLIGMLSENGYRIGMYEAEMVPHRELNLDRYENMEYFESRNLVRPFLFFKLQMKLVFLKYMPWQLKPFFTVTPDQVEYEAEIANAHSGMFSYDNLYFHSRITEEEIRIGDEKCFRFIHIKGAHQPYDINAKLEHIENGTDIDGIEASMTLTGEYLGKLKEAGVYDNSVIIIMADHGYIHRQNPVLFIKGLGEKHEYAVSDAPVSHADLQEAYRRLFNGCTGKDAFDWKDGDLRERRFLYYPFEDDSVIYEMTLTGDAVDSDSLTETGTVYRR